MDNDKPKHPYCRSRTERFAAYIKYEPPPPGVEGDCWIWTGRIVDGYGRMWDGGSEKMAHVASYEEHVGPMPPGHELDHLCRRRPCFNPGHLEVVTHKENVRRGYAPTMVVHRTGICKKGLHKIEGNNAYSTSDGFTTCRQCRKDAQREWYLRKLAAQGQEPVGKGHSRTP